LIFQGLKRNKISFIAEIELKRPGGSENGQVFHLLGTFVVLFWWGDFC
jgi:hypothetical protein